MIYIACVYKTKVDSSVLLLSCSDCLSRRDLRGRLGSGNSGNRNASLEKCFRGSKRIRNLMPDQTTSASLFLAAIISILNSTQNKMGGKTLIACCYFTSC